jgi:hypothetical protein
LGVASTFVAPSGGIYMARGFIFAGGAGVGTVGGATMGPAVAPGRGGRARGRWAGGLSFSQGGQLGEEG